MEICLRYGYFEPLRVSHDARSGSKWRQFSDFFSSFWTIMVWCVYSLELPRWGNSNEYTQHTVYWYSKTISLNIYFLELLEEFRRDSKRVQIRLGKRAIGVWATEVRLYIGFGLSAFQCFCCTESRALDKKGYQVAVFLVFSPWKHTVCFGYTLEAPHHCGYSLDVPHYGGSNTYHKIYFIGNKYLNIEYISLIWNKIIIRYNIATYITP